MYKVKILVLGPSKSGKTVIANHLAEATESSDGHYKPTQGCRILEFQVSDVQLNGKKVNAEVELWDCSGDHKFESCWPAMARDVSGIVFVCNPDQLGHEAELESWYSYYVRQHGLRDTQCIVFEHRKSKDVEQRISLSGAIGKLNSVITSSDDDDEISQIKNHFTTYLSRLFVVLSEKREEEEMTILNNR